MTVVLGSPRWHLRRTGSTNERARALAAGGAPHGTMVTAGEQSAGRGRQGRDWSAPAGRSVLMSLVLREPGPLLSLAAGVAVAEVAEAMDATGRPAMVKWPNDVLLEGGKVAGILVEGRPAQGWAVLGVGLNVAVRPGDLDAEVARRATGLGREPDDVEGALAALTVALGRWLASPVANVLAALNARDALRGRPVRWTAGSGIGAGIDADGRLRVDTGEGTVALDAGEVHLVSRG